MDLQPSRLAIWNYPGDAVELLLRCAEVWHAVTLSSARVIELVPRLTRALQDAEGVLIRWGTNRPRTPGRHPHSLSTKHLNAARDAIDLALDWPSLETALICAENGFRGFESRDWVVRFPRDDQDIRYEALDRIIGRNLGLVPDLSEVDQDMALLMEWAEQQSPGKEWAMGNTEFRAARRVAQRIRFQSIREFDEDTPLPGFTLGEAHSMWDRLHADAFVASILTVTHRDPRSAVLTPRRETLVQAFSADVSGAEAASSFVDALTFRPGYHPDAAMAPLVASGEELLVPPGLILGSNFERNLLRAICIDPSLGGLIGAARGRKGTEQVAALLRTMSGVDVRTNVPAVGPGRKSAGDLDVVAVDRTAGEGVIVEVKWPAPPDHMMEILHVERLSQEAQEKAKTLRSQLESGTARLRDWPTTWPSFNGVKWSWYLLVKDHIPYSDEARRHSIRPISWELLWHYAQDTLRATVEKLASENYLPQEGDDYKRVWRNTRLGPYRIEIENFEMFKGVGDPRDISRIIERED